MLCLFAQKRCGEFGIISFTNVGIVSLQVPMQTETLPLFAMERKTSVGIVKTLSKCFSPGILVLHQVIFTCHFARHVCGETCCDCENADISNICTSPQSLDCERTWIARVGRILKVSENKFDILTQEEGTNRGLRVSRGRTSGPSLFRH